MGIWWKETTRGHSSGVWGKNGESGGWKRLRRVGMEGWCQGGGGVVMGGGRVRKRWSHLFDWISHSEELL